MYFTINLHTYQQLLKHNYTLIATIEYVAIYLKCAINKGGNWSL